ncbi:MAG TPA: AAA family ATPase [Chloroflexaceae bacterium]|nr:AAA family ATPase [Chloroflexaceae bacterium]
MSKLSHPLLRRLRDELNYKIRSGPTTLGYELFYLDLSSWKLRLSDRTPVVWVKPRDVDMRSPQHLIDSLRDVMRANHLRRDPLVALVDGEAEPLRQYANNLQERARIVVIGADEQARLLQSRRPTGDLRDIVLSQLSVSLLAPYETAAPVIGSRFFGREYEISRILENPDTNFVILGIRRIGKTSLLKEIERRLREREEDHENGHIIYIDCSDLSSPEDYIREVVRKLNPTELPRLHLQYAFFFPDFLERMARKHRRKLIFLLDEIDNLILLQRGGWELFRMFRSSSNKGFAQYIMAGFREAMNEKIAIDSPLFNMAQEVRLNEFKRKQAHDLIVVPMENLGVGFRDKAQVIERIFAETAGHPNLIQYYCTILLRSIDLSQSDERTICLDSLIDVYQDAGFKDHLVASFIQNTQNREKALVCALLTRQNSGGLGGFTQVHMDASLRRHGITLRQGEIENACSVLKLAGIFDQHGQEYFFVSPVFVRVLTESYDVQYLIRKAREEGV